MSFNTYFQDELTWLREAGREYAKAHPEAGGMLADTGSDPDVERMLEGFAFISGRLRQKLDDELPELTHALIDTLWPHYLRPVPALTVLQFEAVRANDKELRRVPVGTPVDSVPVDGTRCRFHTAYPVEVPPLRITGLALRSAQPATLTLELRLSDGVRAAQLPGLGVERLRFHCVGPMAIAGGLHLCLTRHCTTVTAIAAGQRVVLPAGCVRPVGFAADEALLGPAPDSFNGFALLREWFAFPQKFLFVDLVGLEALAKLGEATELSIEFALSRVPDQLPQVSDANLVLGCTPAVNLFAHDAAPVLYDPRRTEYPIIPSGDDPTHYEVASLDSVSGVVPGEERTRPIPRLFHGGRAPDGGASGHIVRRRPALTGPGTRLDVAIHGRPPGVETLSFAVTCTNGRLPQGLAPGDIRLATDRCPPGLRFRNLAKPTASVPPPLGGHLEWRLLAHLGLNYRSLGDIETLRSVIDLYDVRALVDHQARSAHRRLLDGLVQVDAAPDTLVVDGALMRGIAVTIQAKESHFDGEGEIHLLALVLDAFFAQYAGLNSFSRLTITGTESGVELRLPARLGRRRII